jgi:hypothetical protein
MRAASAFSIATATFGSLSSTFWKAGQPHRQHLALRLHGGRAREAVQQRQLAEEVAGLQPHRSLARLAHAGDPIQDHVEAVAGVAHPHDRGERGVALHGGLAADPPQVAL